MNSEGYKRTYTVSSITVNTPTKEYDYQYQEQLGSIAAIVKAKRKHPDWTSMVMVVVRAQP